MAPVGLWGQALRSRKQGHPRSPDAGEHRTSPTHRAHEEITGLVAGCWVVVAYREGMIDESKIAERYRALGPELNERQRRLWAASEARSHGGGGLGGVLGGRGIRKNRGVRGIGGVRGGARWDVGRVRRAGAGR